MKKGDKDRTSSWAAKRRCSWPTTNVMMGLVRVLHVCRQRPELYSSHSTASNSPPNRRAVQLLLQLQLRLRVIRLLARFDRLARTIFGMERTFKHVDQARG